MVYLVAFRFWNPLIPSKLAPQPYAETFCLIPASQSTGCIWFRFDHSHCLRSLVWWKCTIALCPKRRSFRWALSSTMWTASKSWFSKHSWRCRSVWYESSIFERISSSVHSVCSRAMRQRIEPERLSQFIDETFTGFWWSNTCVWYLLSFISSYLSKLIHPLHLYFQSIDNDGPSWHRVGLVPRHLAYSRISTLANETLVVVGCLVSWLGRMLDGMVLSWSGIVVGFGYIKLWGLGNTSFV